MECSSRPKSGSDMVAPDEACEATTENGNPAVKTAASDLAQSRGSGSCGGATIALWGSPSPTATAVSLMGSEPPHEDDVSEAAAPRPPEFGEPPPTLPDPPWPPTVNEGVVGRGGGGGRRRVVSASKVPTRPIIVGEGLKDTSRTGDRGRDPKDEGGLNRNDDGGATGMDPERRRERRGGGGEGGPRGCKKPEVEGDGDVWSNCVALGPTMAGVLLIVKLRAAFDEPLDCLASDRELCVRFEPGASVVAELELALIGAGKVFKVPVSGEAKLDVVGIMG